MSTKLLDMMTNLGELSVDDLLTLQEQIKQQLKTKSSHHESITTSIGQINLPGLHTFTPEEIQTILPGILILEEQAQLGQLNFDNLVIGPKSASEILNEDREDRF